MVHALETHTTLINETMWELQASRETTDAPYQSCIALEKELHNTQRTVDNLAREMARDWQSRYKIDNPFRAVDITIEWLQRLVERLNGGLASAAMERISPALFPPNTITGRRHRNQKQPTHRTLTLYRVIGLARATTNGSTSLQYTGLPQYLATSPDQQTSIELSAEMVGPCRSAKQAICPISQAVSRKNNKGPCSVAIFLDDNHRIEGDCAVVLTPWTGQDAVYLGHRRLGLSVTNVSRLIVTCPHYATGPNSYTIDTPAISIFEIPMSCTAQSDDWVFRASFRKDTHRKWITRTTPQLTDLRIPGRPLITTQDEIQPPDQTDR
ncbi:hypothetical protein DAPPUDRAFT_117028 [Daphnia pulex]|uniref:Uncharacterized protein n=1 Tax=Daphnia pulex TaxID=6669 RepID=E9HRA0_DAPPU|nr:hypothetical protein DAPPUDRAFT_117028 [Daphnia pulex]|eukprot:EFX65713.1 hypothetical protein DAPPUDRAFT_117028 [Daphnia pulex]